MITLNRTTTRRILRQASVGSLKFRKSHRSPTDRQLASRHCFKRRCQDRRATPRAHSDRAAQEKRKFGRTPRRSHQAPSLCRWSNRMPLIRTKSAELNSEPSPQTCQPEILSDNVQNHRVAANDVDLNFGPAGNYGAFSCCFAFEACSDFQSVRRIVGFYKREFGSCDCNAMFLGNCHLRRERNTAMIIATGTRPNIRMMRISGIPGMPIASTILRLFLTSEVDYRVFVSSNLSMGSGITSTFTRSRRMIVHSKTPDFAKQVQCSFILRCLGKRSRSVA